MAIIKCKMCGGDIVLDEEKTFGTCEYCGSVMTLPKVSDDQRAARFNRGNHFRRQGEFDKALAVYESIVREDDADAEAHWCCALCRFGIEYVEDPNTYEYMPTCHRASFDSFLEDVDYLAALDHSDGITRRQYQKDAAKIAEVQRGILATSQNEEPFDVFICYKETDDETHERTRDSIDAQEIYYQLTQEGYRVFFSRITLEDKAGTEYEPYIFAALNSAKVMIAIGSKPEYFSAVWVKNEWSRFLAMMRRDRSKLLLPCYKNMDPYDLPEQLGVLQSYDMTKIGFMQDLIRGVQKVLQKDEPQTPVQQVVIRKTASAGGPNVTALLQRGNMALEDKEWDKAKEFFDQVLNMDAQNAEAYLGIVLANAQLCDRDAFANAFIDRRVADSSEQKRARSFADSDQRAWWNKLDDARKSVDDRKATAKRLAEEKREAAVIAERERKEAERKAEAERKRKAEAQAQEYAVKVIAAIRQKLSEKVPSPETQLAVARQRAAEITQLCAAYDNLQAQVSQKKTQLEQFEQNKDQLRKRHASLGIFAGKEKKQIDAQLEALDRQAAQVSTEQSNLYRQLQGFETKALVEQAKAKAEAVVSELEQRILEQKAAQNNSFSYEIAVAVLSNNKRVRELVYQKDAALLQSVPNGAVLIASVDSTISSISFGHYPQKQGAASETIEWVILQREPEKILLISKYALDCQRYNTSRTGVTWETCSLRKWLNGTFISNAFSSDEQNMILSTNVTADKNPSGITYPGNNTTDKVFLLSITEANKYFSTDSARKCLGTAYCFAQGAYKASNGDCLWWLRSPGNYTFFATYVNIDGSIGSRGYDVSRDQAVRPAMWISLK